MVFVRYLFSVLLSFCVTISWGQDVTLNSQADVDAFDSSITEINGDLEISGNDITDLSNLSNLELIEGKLQIIFTTALTNIDGLANLSIIQGALNIHENNSLSNLDGLASVTSIGSSLNLYDNDALTNIDGLAKISNITGHLFISNNNNLINIDGLTSLTSISGYLSIHYNDALTNIDGLVNLTFVDGFLEIKSNNALINIDGLANLTSTTSFMEISSNNALTNIDGLTNLNTIDGYLYISLNTVLTNIDGLANLTFIGDFINISYNNALTNIDGLSKLFSINEFLEIIDNDKLKNINGISNLSYINGYLKIKENDALTNCCGIQELLNTPNAILSSITINDNPSECSSEQEIIESDCNENSISGFAFFDKNQNKIQDNDEFGIPNIRLSSDIHDFNLSDRIGHFVEYREIGDAYQISIENNPSWELTTDSTSYSGIYNPENNNNENLNFGLFPLNGFHKLVGFLTSNPTRCNTNVDFFLKAQNLGTFIEDGDIIFDYDDETSFIDAIPYPQEIDTIGHTLSWDIDLLSPFAIQEIIVTLEMPDETGTGDIMNFNLEVYRDSLNTFVLEDEFDYESIVLCSFDPNDKLISPAGVQDENYTLRDETMTYTIRFQNTGNAEALDIKILDTLDNDFDLNTFKVLHSSFPVRTTLNENRIEFFFKDIYLPDSTSNEPESHGFVAYEIKLKEDAPDYTVVENTAHIIFDFNPPIVTNTTTSTMVEMIPVGVANIASSPINIRPNPASGFIEVYSEEHLSLENIAIYNLIGEQVLQSVETRIDISEIPSGLYFLYTEINGNAVVEKFVKE